MGLATLICWLSWITVLYYINPLISGTMGFICFFSSLFFSLLGTLSSIGLFLRLIVKKQELPYKHIGISLRQALWFSILITMSLVLLGQKLFTWWSVSLLIIGLVVLEGLFLFQTASKKQVGPGIKKDYKDFQVRQINTEQ